MVSTKKNKLGCGFLLLALCVASKVSLAEDFTAEVGYSRYFAKDYVSNLINATWYLEPVKTDGVPLAEAAFFQRVSSVGVRAARLKFDDGSYNSKDHFESLAVKYASPTHPYFLGINYMEDSEDSSLGDTRSNEWGLAAGYFLSKGLEVAAYASRSNISLSGQSGDLSAGTQGVGVKWVKILPAGNAMSLIVDLSRTRSENNSTADSKSQTYSVAGNYYFTPHINAGLRYAYESEDDDSDLNAHVYSVSTNIFLTQRFFIEASVTRWDFKGAGLSVDDVWSASLGYRF